MALRHRPMRPEDVQECVEIVAAHPTLGPPLDRPLDEVLAEPHLAGLTRELAMARVGTWSGSLFVYQPPQFRFRPSEQCLLLAALQGGRDEDISETLEISLSAVKKTWRFMRG